MEERKEFDYMNEVIEQGTIVGKREGNGYVLLTLATDLYPVASAGEISYKRNFPHAFFVGEAAERARQFRIRDIVTVKGSAQTRRGKIGKKDAYLFSFAADSIEEAPKVYIKGNVSPSGRIYEAELNEVRIAGQIADYRIVRDDLISVRFRIEQNNGRSRYVDATYRMGVQKFTSQIKPGDYVYMIGQIQTREPEKGMPRRTEWLAAKEIIKAVERSEKNVQKNE